MNLSLEELKQRNAGSQPVEPIPQQPLQNSPSCPLTQEKLDNLFYNQGLIWDGNRELGETAENLTTAAPQHQNPTEQSTLAGTAGANQQEFVADTADVVTGWETEREAFFSAEAATTAPDMDTVVDRHSPDLAGIGGSMVQLGRSLERLDNSVPINDTTTKPQQHTGRKKKLAIGQKEDDHSGHDFEMKM